MTFIEYYSNDKNLPLYEYEDGTKVIEILPYDKEITLTVQARILKCLAQTNLDNAIGVHLAYPYTLDGLRETNLMMIRTSGILQDTLTGETLIN